MPAHRAQAQEDVRADIVHLKDKNPQVAFQAAQHLGLLGAEASGALGDLIQTIKTPHSVDVLEASTWAVGRIAEQACAKVHYSDAVRVTPAVAATVRNPENRLSFRQASAYTLGRLAGPLQKSPSLHNLDVQTEAVASLAGILKEKDIADDPRRQEFGRTAAEALGRFRSESKAAVVVISDLLTDVTNRQETHDLPEASRRGLGNLSIGLTVALGYIGADATDAISTLKQLLKAHDIQAQGAAAYALGNIGRAASNSAPELIDTLVNGDTTVRQVAAIALGRVRPQGDSAQKAVAALAAAIGDPDPGVREAAATALGKFSTRDVFTAFPELLAGLTDPDANVVSSAANSLGEIARKSELDSNPNREAMLPKLRQANLALKSWKPPVASASWASESIESARLEIEQAIWQLDPPVLLAWLYKHRTYGVVAVSYLLWILLIKFFVIKFWPNRLIGWNEKLDRLKIDTSILPSVIAPLLAPFKIPFPYLLGIGFFRYDPKVLDAWVEDHCQVAKENFLRQSTVKAHETYIGLPVTLDDGQRSTLPHLSPHNLHKTCSQARWCIRIIGEAGSGKTTLACQMALWALSGRPEDRLCRDRKAIPILIESSPDRFDDEWNFTSLIRTQVKVLTGATKTISDALLDRLLQTRRLIVLLDGASEMEDTSVGEKRRIRIDGDFPACGLIVTSRTTRPFAPNGVYTDIGPNRIDSEYVSCVVNAYLQEADSKLEDQSLSETCRRLSAMVGVNTE
jgi:HEAT repeat protein